MRSANLALVGGVARALGCTARPRPSGSSSGCVDAVAPSSGTARSIGGSGGSPARRRAPEAAGPEASRLAAAAVMCLTAAVLAVAGVARGAAAGAAAARPAAVVSPSELAGRLQAAHALAVEGRAAPSPARMEEVRARVGFPLTVALSERQRVLVAADPVLDGLHGGRTADFGRAADHLAELSRAATAATQAPALDAARMRATLERAYRGIDTQRSLRDRLQELALLLLARLVRFFSGALSGAPGLLRVGGYLLVGGVVVVALLLLVRLLRQIGLVPSGATRRPGRQPERTDWAAAAEEALGRGETREAVRALYRGLVEVLVAKGLVPDLPSLTPAECRRALGSHPGLSPALDHATSAFERVVYGRAHASQGDVEALREAGRAARAA